MIIAIPVEDTRTEICEAFGRTPEFCIYDTETKEKRFVDNSGNAVQGGAGIKACLLYTSFRSILDIKKNR